VGIGTNANDDGLIILKSGKNQASATIEGTGIFQANNGDGKVVATLGVSGFNGGDLHLRNRTGADVVGLFATQTGTGIAQLFNAGGQERVTLGTLENGKGDVCVSGYQGANCLHQINVKY
jgi:hypothetical protein